jgi:TRAP-type C4-dicarboxylate transport system substrate-binding protein
LDGADRSGYDACTNSSHLAIAQHFVLRSCGWTWNGPRRIAQLGRFGKATALTRSIFSGGIMVARHWTVALRGFAVAATLALPLGLVPGSAVKAVEHQILKVALPIPRSQDMAIEVKKYNDKLAVLTNNTVEVRVWWGGAAGDDTVVLHKLKDGSMDAAAFSMELVSQFVRQALVMSSPGLFSNYKQVDAVRAALTPAMDKEAYANGFKVMGWGDIGRLRLLSKEPIATVADFKRMRPWLYPQSETMKEFYRMIGANGVPLPLMEVYSGLTTNMIDVVWSTSVLAAALQWHAGTHFITEQGLGFVGGAFVIRRGAWDALPESAQNSMLQLANEQRQKNQIEIRKADERAFAKLVSRGHTSVKLQNLNEWQKLGSDLRVRMIGRIYTKELVSQAEQIAAKYAD